ncbi:MAG: hypothetical protein J0I08_13325 [Rhizobiales bacterium]|nr:hypothetical protein [Hyphomicrobiales bacterium]
MFVRLTRTLRRRAGWLIALVYLLCVLAPTLSFALPGSRATAYCLTGEGHIPGMVHVHDKSTMHVHQDGHAHHHSGVQMQADPSVDHVVKAAAVKSDFSPAKASHMMDGKCCGLMCVTAIPALYVAMTQPSAPKAIRVSDSYRKLTDNAPAVHYRPPIS